MTNDFRKYAVKHLGMNGLALDQYAQFTSSYLSPSIMEERQLNVRVFAFNDGPYNLFGNSYR